MLKYIIRLDDACPNMRKDNWEKVERLLDKYNIKPIVGIIPNCKDKEFEKYKIIENFWDDYALKWQQKDWIIAQHGLNHNLDENIRTEYVGKDYEEQKDNLIQGNKILKEHHIHPICFFAPAHTFDDNTIKACVDLQYFSFISDGVAIYPYNYKNMFFMPNIFDTPHKILPFGIYTFVFHPNNMRDSDYEYLEKFIIKNIDNFDMNLNEILEQYKNRKVNILDKFILFLINTMRKIKGVKR